eukprot:12939212-Prorocentrum_lima.AAC.1
MAAAPVDVVWLPDAHPRLKNSHQPRQTAFGATHAMQRHPDGIPSQCPPLGDRLRPPHCHF